MCSRFRVLTISGLELESKKNGPRVRILRDLPGDGSKGPETEIKVQECKIHHLQKMISLVFLCP